MPEKEQIASFNEDKDASINGSTNASSNGANTGTTNGTLQNTPGSPTNGDPNNATAAGTAGAASKIMKKASAQEKEQGATTVSISLTEVESDVRSLLLQIQTKEFATMIYD